MKEMVLFLVFFFSFRWHVEEKGLVGYREWFEVIVNLFMHLELLMYAKSISFLAGSNNVYGIIFYQMYLLPWLTIPPPPPPFLNLVLWNYGHVVFGWWVTSKSLSGYEKVCYDVCVCFWPPVSKPCPNYKVVVFQPHPLDIPDLSSLHPPSKFSSPPKSKIHASDKTRLTKDGNGHMEGHQCRH